MKGKRYTTEEKIRILRQADGGRKITDVCREHNVSEVNFHRRKKQFGQMDINEAKRLKELERENGELKKMLAEALLKNRVLEAVCEKSGEPGAPSPGRPGSGGQQAVLRTGSVPVPPPKPFDPAVSTAGGHAVGRKAGQEDGRAVAPASALRLPQDRHAAAT